MQGDGYSAFARVHHLGDLGVVIPLEVAKNEHFSGCRVQSRHSGAQSIPFLRCILMLRGVVAGIAQAVQFDSFQRDGSGAFPGSNQVERSVHSGPVQVPARVVDAIEGVSMPDEPQEHRLKHVFGVGRIAGDPVCRPENAVVVGPENAFDAFRLISHNDSL
jgi:hypothetical protein